MDIGKQSPARIITPATVPVPKEQPRRPAVPAEPGRSKPSRPAPLDPEKVPEKVPSK